MFYEYINNKVNKQLEKLGYKTVVDDGVVARYEAYDEKEELRLILSIEPIDPVRYAIRSYGVNRGGEVQYQNLTLTLDVAKLAVKKAKVRGWK